MSTTICRLPGPIPGPIKWSRNHAGIEATQIMGGIYLRVTFIIGPAKCVVPECEDINQVLVPELQRIDAIQCADQRELAAVRFRHFLMDSLNDYKGRVNFFGVTGIQVLTDPARVVLTSAPAEETITVQFDRLLVSIPLPSKERT